MSQFRVSVDVSNGVGRLRWDAQDVDAATLERAVSLAADDALIGQNLRRLQVELPEWDTNARVALHRAGFRLEGRLRCILEPEPGVYRDALVYGRLAVDPVYGAHGFTGVLDSLLPKKRVIAHALFRDATGRVLLLETTYKDDWELPGGVVEPGESPRAGAEREIAEELGLAVTLGPPALVDWMPPYLGWSDAIELIFDGGVLPDASAPMPNDHEIREAHWIAPGDVAGHVSELSARRIAHILDGGGGYSEAGHPQV